MKYLKMGLCIFGFLFLVSLCSTSKPTSNKTTSTQSTTLDVKPEVKPTPDMSRKEFATKCGGNADHAYFEQSCKGKTILLKGIINEVDSDSKVEIDFGDKSPWNLELDKTTPRYEKGTRVEFSATLQDQMGWGAHMKNGHFWAKLDASAVKETGEFHVPAEKKREAKEAISKLTSEGIIQKVNVSSKDIVEVWIEPKFYALPYDLKDGLASWVYLAHFNDKNGYIVFIDGYSGKDIGNYSLLSKLKLKG